MRHPFSIAITLLALIALAHPTRARADNSNSNRQIVPLGESESFMANSGVGRATDTGSVYYNPGSLAEMKSGRVSVTGSVYLSFNNQTNAIVHLDDTNVGYQASGFNTIPAFYVASYKLGDWYGAISILVPNSITVENRVPFTTPNTASNIVQATRSSDLWVGLSAAHRINERWSLGATLFGVQHSEVLTEGLDIQYPAQPTQNMVSLLEQNDLNVFGLSLVVGVSYIANDWLRFGLRAQTQLVQLYGQADTFESAHSITGGTVSPISGANESLQGTPGNYQIPFDFTLGAALAPTDWFTFLFDFSLQLGTSYSSIPASILNEQVSLMPTPRVNLGVEFLPWDWFPVRTGFYYNPSANNGTAGTPGFISENYMGYTLGVGLKSARVETGVGLFYIWGNGTTTPYGAPGTTATLSSHGTGGLLTASYLL